MVQNSSSLESGLFIAFRKGFVRERASEQLQSVIWPLHKGVVKESASEQLQSVIKPFGKGFVLLKQHASEQLQSVIKPFLKGFVKGKASDKLQSVIKPFLKRICKGKGFRTVQYCKMEFGVTKTNKSICILIAFPHKASFLLYCINKMGLPS